MNHAIVIDASVVVKRVLDEEFTDRVRVLFDHCVHARRPILGPPHLIIEVTNAVYQRLRRRDITSAEAEEALAQFLNLPIQIMLPEGVYQKLGGGGRIRDARFSVPLRVPGLYHRAVTFAKTYHLQSVYDSLYVVLAQILQTELWTDDRTLLNALGTAAPWVRWIGDYPLA